jgi:hypothetical protein
MEHELVAAQNMTERYLLNELDPAVRDEFEEHYFNCAACAADVQAAALLIEKIKDGAIPDLAIPDPERRTSPATAPIPTRSAWHGWLRPALVIPMMAMLLVVVGYQNLVTYPYLARQLNRPQILPYAQVNLDTYASEGPTITPQPGQAFLLLVRIPPGGVYSQYTADLYNPAGKLEWSFAFTIPASSQQDHWPLQVPGSNRETGRYSLKVRGVTAAGESKDVGSTSFELQIQK